MTPQAGTTIEYTHKASRLIWFSPHPIYLIDPNRQSTAFCEWGPLVHAAITPSGNPVSTDSAKLGRIRGRRSDQRPPHGAILSTVVNSMAKHSDLLPDKFLSVYDMYPAQNIVVAGSCSEKTINTASPALPDARRAATYVLHKLRAVNSNESHATAPAIHLRSSLSSVRVTESKQAASHQQP